MSLPIPSSPGYLEAFLGLVAGPGASGIRDLPQASATRVRHMAGMDRPNPLRTVDAEGRTVYAEHVTDGAWAYYHERPAPTREVLEEAAEYVATMVRRGLISEDAQANLRGWFRDQFSRLPSLPPAEEIPVADYEILGAENGS